MTDYAALVEPRLGTNTGRWIAFSSACLPFGMVNLSPDTRINGDWGCGYKYADTRIIGFSHIHAWQISGILVMPTTGGNPCDGPDAFASDFSHESEICKPGYHKVHLDRCNITAELTATLRVGVHRYTFAPDSDASIYIDLSSTLGPCDMGGASLIQTSPTTLEGWVINQPTIRKPKKLKIHFVIQFSREAKLNAFNTNSIRALIQLGKPTEPVTMKVAISYTSIEAAKENLRIETENLSFDQIRSLASNEWNRWLSRIEVEGGSDEQQARFYTDLYFSLLGRRVVSDARGTYIDNTGDSPVVRQIETDDTGNPKYRHHNSDSFWGAQWSITPLWAIAYPRVIDDFCRCFFDMYQNGGLIPRGPAGGNYTFVMTSAQSTPLYACAINSDIYKPANVDIVYKAIRKNHFPGGLMSKCGYEHTTCIGGGIEDYLNLGYIPEDLPKAGFHNNGAAQTIEHSFNDWSLSQLATKLNKPDDAKSFVDRSRNWRNLFDPTIGFIRPKNRDGSWLEPFDPWSRKGWTEANAWTYTFHVPHDLKGLIQSFGSRDKMFARLTEAFEITREKGFFVQHEKHQEIPIDFGNEPALACAHLFQAAGDHKLTQYWIRQIFDNLKSGNAPIDSFGGDEDQGIMGAWNVLVAIGLFSIDGASGAIPTYQVTAPIFKKVTIHLDDNYFSGKKFRIITRGNKPGQLSYIQSGIIDNKQLKQLDITHSQITNGGVLFLDLTCDASKAIRLSAEEVREKPVPFQVWGKDIEAGAMDQMRNAARLPISVRGALMPDAHQGYGLPIGGVLATDNAVIPYAVGVDIACRMKLSVYDIPASRLSKMHDTLTKALQKQTVFGTGGWSIKPMPNSAPAAAETILLSLASSRLISPISVCLQVNISHCSAIADRADQARLLPITIPILRCNSIPIYQRN